MSKLNGKEGYAVGYGKPPKSGQFMKGVSGNPSGRSKKQADFGSELMRELSLPLVINENGKRRVIKRSQGLVKQLTNKGLSGNTAAIRELLVRWEQALEKAAERERKCLEDLNRTPREMSDEELLAHIINEVAKSTSKGEMAIALTEVVRQLGLDKPEYFRSFVSGRGDAVFQLPTAGNELSVP